MARARNIKPGFFKNEILGVADPLLSLLFEGLWVLADRAGRLEDRPLRIKGEVFPYRDGVDVDSMLDWLQENGFIQRYAVGGKKCILVLEFVKHQNPHKNETESELPAPSSDCTTSEEIGTKPEIIRSTRADSLSTDSLIPDTPLPTPSASPRVDLFEEFWKAYPKKKAKDDAEKAFDKRKPDRQLLASILSAIAVQSRSEDWVKDGGKFIPYPATWLNDGRWQDGETVELVTAPRGPDPALQKILADDKKAAPIPENVRAQLAGMRFKFKESA